MTDSPKLTRRSVSLGALAAAGCYAGLNRDALAAALATARARGRPMLTEATINAAFPPPGQRGYDAALMEAAADLRSFLRRRFSLTPVQEQEIAGMRQAELQALSQMLNRARARRERISIKIRAGQFGKGVSISTPREMTRLTLGKTPALKPAVQPQIVKPRIQPQIRPRTPRGQ